jgi:sigma-E factor negative regulatory protein RseA
MLTTSEPDAATRERLSALADGELEAGAVAPLCGHWGRSGEARATWHTYQLIGDVLRSDDLAGDPAHDARFIASLRARLATEPVPLAPRPFADPSASTPARAPEGGHIAAASAGRRWSWMAPTAVAAGFVAVAGVLTLTRTAGNLPEQPVAASGLAQARDNGGAPAATLVGPAARIAEPQSLVASGELIRDARLDRYLAAHKQFAGSSALGVPSGFLRNATAEAAAR